ncbi:MAG TPA: hypothetical protein VIJ40_11000 [Acidimicrobiales bacterium]
MTWQRWITGRTLIVSGYVVTFAAATVFALWVLSNSVIGNLPTSYWVQEILFPVASLGTLIAWWFLTEISVSSTGQGDLFRKGFLALSTASLLACAAYVVPLINYFHLDWNHFDQLLYAVGSFTTACGFFMVASHYSSNAETNEDALLFDRSVSEEGDNISFEQVKRELG